MRSAPLLIFAAAIALGCASPDERSKPRPESKLAASLADRGFYGTIVPRKATPLHAPPNVFRMKGWNSRSTSIKLISIVPDGATVKKDEEVARFEFGSEEALPWIKKRIAETKADLDNAKTRNDEDARRRRSDAAVKKLAQESAELDLGRKGLVSERDLALFGLAAARAKVEADASSQQARAQVASADAELVFFDVRADDWNNSIERYNAYEKRTHIPAPHAGIVRYAYLNHARRKVQKPDDMPSGTPFVFIAEDDRLSVETYIPEHRLGALGPGKTISVRLPDDERRVPATVRQVLPFPQEIGFLRGDDELPDAREKAYPVIADIDPAPPFLSSGLEVRVEP
ncbi:MAG: HlyD family efflux transporter periplasmic adaptor subunit [Byssovorax sp.]